MRDGLLADYVRDKKLNKEDDALEFFKYMLKGLELIHAMKLFHGNINPFTIWIDRKRAILDGLYLDPKFNHKHSHDFPVNHYRIQSSSLPEKNRSSFNQKEIETQQTSDLHSLGLVLYFMASKTHPPEIKDVVQASSLIKTVSSQKIKDVLAQVFKSDVTTTNLMRSLKMDPWTDDGKFFS